MYCYISILLSFCGLDRFDFLDVPHQTVYLYDSKIGTLV